MDFCSGFGTGIVLQKTNLIFLNASCSEAAEAGISEVNHIKTKK